MATELAQGRQPAPNAADLGGHHQRRWVLVFAVLALAVYLFYRFLLPNLPDSTQTTFQGWLPLLSVNEALVWVIAAVGLNIVVGYAGLLDLGFVAFWAIGGYTAGWIMSSFFYQVQNGFSIFSTASGQPGIHLNWWLVLLVAGLFCAFCGIIIGAPTLRLKSDYLALVTLGFGEIIPQVFKNGESVFGFNLTNGVKGIAPLDEITVVPGGESLGPFDLETKYLLFVGIAAFCVFVSLRIREGRLGRAWLAIREDELAASMMGVPLMRSKLAAYAVGAFMGGLAGVVYAVHVNSVFSDQFSFSISIILLAMVVLGGMGNVWGVIVGALLLAWFNSTGLPQFGDWFNGQFNTEVNFPSYNFLIFGSLLVLMMLFRREGFFPETRTRQVLQEPERTGLESVGADLEGVTS